MPNKKWFCAKVSTRRETRVARQLADWHGVETFCPMIQSFYRLRTGQEKFRTLALFPGYLFFLAAGAAEAMSVQRAMGVAYVLGNGTGEAFAPQEIASEWVAELQAAGPVVKGKAQAYRKGDRVKIALSAIAELIGEVEGVDAKGVVSVKVELFGKSHKQRLLASEIEPAA